MGRNKQSGSINLEKILKEAKLAGLKRWEKVYGLDEKLGCIKDLLGICIDVSLVYFKDYYVKQQEEEHKDEYNPIDGQII